MKELTTRGMNPEQEQKHWERCVKATKECRVIADDVLQAIRSLPQTRETSLSITKIQESIMWLGMELKRLGTTNPYPDSYNPENTKIAPTADNLKL